MSNSRSTSIAALIAVLQSAITASIGQQSPVIALWLGTLALIGLLVLHREGGGTPAI